MGGVSRALNAVFVGDPLLARDSVEFHALSAHAECATLADDVHGLRGEAIRTAKTAVTIVRIGGLHTLPQKAGRHGEATVKVNCGYTRADS